MNEHLSEILELPIQERIRLAEELWDSIVPEPGAVKLTDEQAAELERRLEDYRQNPDKVVPWDEVRERLRKIA